jgi:general secretion pathway protein A
MYEAYWKLRCNPFQNVAGPEFLYLSETHRAALLKLRYVLENRLGAGLLSGGTGYGKTYLAQVFARQLPEHYAPRVHLVFPQLSPAELLAYLAVELGVDEAEVGRDDGRLDRTVRRIERELRAHSEHGRHPVIVLDEAQLIDDQRVFQMLQLLLNFQQHARADFSLILVGDRPLLGRMRRLPQLDDRIGARAILQPLSENEVETYVAHRMKAAGATRPIFDDSALVALFEFSGGVPRRINRLCDLALLVGFAESRSEISAEEIEAVGEEFVSLAA